MAKKEKATAKITDDGWRVVKVAHQKNRTFVRLEQKVNGETAHKETTSGDTPNPEFVKALGTLNKIMCNHLKMQDEWKNIARAQGVSVDYSDEEHGQMGMVYTMYIPLTHLNGGFPLNTPRLIEKVAGAKGGTYMTDGILNAVKSLLREAVKYYEGDRAQQDLVDKINEEDEESEKKKVAKQ